MNNIIKSVKVACLNVFSCSNIDCKGCILYEDISRIVSKSDNILMSFSHSDRNNIIISALYGMLSEKYNKNIAKEFSNKLRSLISNE